MVSVGGGDREALCTLASCSLHGVPEAKSPFCFGEDQVSVLTTFQKLSSDQGY